MGNKPLWIEHEEAVRERIKDGVLRTDVNDLLLGRIQRGQADLDRPTAADFKCGAYFQLPDLLLYTGPSGEEVVLKRRRPEGM